MLEDGLNALIGQEWQVFPDMSVDSNFVGSLIAKLEQLGADKNSKICFLCRSGVRSLAAARAMTAHGYPNTYNITGGFEGDVDGQRHRGLTNGWKAEGLPWHQN
jgi:rhodanese-related sulfurtransferase